MIHTALSLSLSLSVAASIAAFTVKGGLIQPSCHPTLEIRSASMIWKNLTNRLISGGSNGTKARASLGAQINIPLP